MPVVIGLGVSSLLWVWLLDDRVGIFNKILLDLNLVPKAQLFLGRPNTAMNVIILSVVWKTVGFTMILLLAGLQAIPGGTYTNQPKSMALAISGSSFTSPCRLCAAPSLSP